MLREMSHVSGEARKALRETTRRKRGGNRGRAKIEEAAGMWVAQRGREGDPCDVGEGEKEVNRQSVGRSAHPLSSLPSRSVWK